MKLKKYLPAGVTLRQASMKQLEAALRKEALRRLKLGVGVAALTTVGIGGLIVAVDTKPKAK